MREERGKEGVRKREEGERGARAPLSGQNNSVEGNGTDVGTHGFSHTP